MFQCTSTDNVETSVDELVEQGTPPQYESTGDEVADALNEVVKEVGLLKDDLAAIRKARDGGAGLANKAGAVISTSHGPQRVAVKLSITRLFGVSTIDQTYGIQIHLKMMWKPPHGEVLPDHSDFGWEPSWVPGHRVRRLMEEVTSSSTFSVKNVKGKKHIVARFESILTVYETLELQSFPIDIQSLGLEICSLHPVTDVVWVPWPEDQMPTCTSAKTLSAMALTWKGIHKTVALDTSLVALNDFELMAEMPYTYRLKQLELDNVVNAIQVEVHCVRKSFFYVLNVLIITFVIISCVFTAWATHPASIEERNNIDFNLVLTAVAFKLVLTEILPVVSYVTLIDYYINISSFFLIVVTVLHTVLPFRTTSLADNSPLTLPALSHQNEEELLRQDRLCLYIMGGLWIGFNICYMLYLCLHKVAACRAHVAASKAKQQLYDNEMDDAADDAADQSAAQLHELSESNEL